MNTAAVLHPFSTLGWILQTCSQDLQWWLDDHDHHHHHIVMIRMMITITLMITQSTMIWILLPKFASLHRSHALMIATWCLDTLTNKENYDHCIQYTSTCSTQASTNHEQLNKWLIKLQLNINLPVPPRPRPHENRRGIRHTACPEKFSKMEYIWNLYEYFKQYIKWLVLKSWKYIDTFARFVCRDVYMYSTGEGKVQKRKQ